MLQSLSAIGKELDKSFSVIGKELEMVSYVSFQVMINHLQNK